MIGAGTIVDGTPLTEIKRNRIGPVAPLTEKGDKAVQHFGSQLLKRKRSAIQKHLKRTAGATIIGSRTLTSLILQPGNHRVGIYQHLAQIIVVVINVHNVVHRISTPLIRFERSANSLQLLLYIYKVFIGFADNEQTTAIASDVLHHF